MKIEKSKAKELFNIAPEWFKKELINEFGEDFFTPKDFRQIKTFEDACKALEISNDSCRPIYDEEESSDEIAYKKLKVIASAINQGWVPDWNDSNQRKWFPYFVLSSGFGFSNSICSFAHTDASVGSRLCFESEEKAEYAGKQFLSLYEDLLTIKD